MPRRKLIKELHFPPLCLSTTLLCHFSPSASDDSVLVANDILKIHLGCHVDGFVAVVAHTHVLSEGPVSGRAADVLAAAHTAAEVALQTMFRVTVETPKTVNISSSAWLEAPFPRDNIFVVLASENYEH